MFGEGVAPVLLVLPELDKDPELDPELAATVGQEIDSSPI